MSLLPSRLHVSSSPDDPKVLDIDGEEAEAAFDVLGSETARRVLASVYEDPKTPTEVRDTVGTSLQNVHYHLDRLESAGLVEPAGTGYSAKGNEMTVYGPANEAVVLFAGRESDSSRLRDLVKRLFGLFLVVGVSTLVFAAVYNWLFAGPEPASGGADIATEGAADTAEVAGSALPPMEPVLAFFLGGCAVLAAVGIWWLYRETRAQG